MLFFIDLKTGNLLLLSQTIYYFVTHHLSRKIFMLFQSKMLVRQGSCNVVMHIGEIYLFYSVIVICIGTKMNNEMKANTNTLMIRLCFI